MSALSVHVPRLTALVLFLLTAFGGWWFLWGRPDPLNQAAESIREAIGVHQQKAFTWRQASTLHLADVPMPGGVVLDLKTSKGLGERGAWRFDPPNSPARLHKTLGTEAKAGARTVLPDPDVVAPDTEIVLRDGAGRRVTVVVWSETGMVKIRK